MTTTAVARRMATTPSSSSDRGDWRDLLAFAETIATVEGFVPKYLLGRPPAILATLIAGAELGLGRMSSLRAIYVIDGKVTLSAEAARALIFAAGHSLGVVADDVQAVARGRRRDETDWTSVEWTLDRAKRANLTGRQAWRFYPRAMLVARATAELARYKFADVLLGFDVAEVIAEELAEPEPPRPRSRAKRASVTEPALEPPQSPVEGPVSLATATPVADTAESGPGPYEPPLPGEDEPPTDDDAKAGSSPSGAIRTNEVGLRRLHARMAETFPNADRETIDRLRHSLVALSTRRRDTGPIQTSAELDDAELMQYDALLNFVHSGELIIGERPDGVFEFRMSGFLYVVELDPPRVTTTAEP